MKKITSLLLVVLMLVSSATLVYATEIRWGENLTSEDGNYIINIYRYDYESYAEIVKYVGDDIFEDKFIVPNEFEGLNVKRIYKGAFVNLKNLKNVIFQGSTFFDEEPSTIERRAFYNCDNMKSLTVSTPVFCKDKCAGWSHGEKVNDFAFKCDEAVATPSKYNLSLLSNLASEYGIKTVYNVNSDSNNQNISCMYYSGLNFNLTVDGKTVNGWKSSNPKIIKVSSKGKAIALKKGKANLSAEVNGTKLVRTFKIELNPCLCKKAVLVNEYGFNYTEIKTVSVKKGKSVNVYIFGKVKSINNVYTNTTKAKIVSKPSAKTLKIKGLKRGTTTLKVKVNGVKTLKLKVKVK